MCLLAAPWPHNALRHHWLIPISCHFRDCKALLVTSLTHVSSAIASAQTFTFPFHVPSVRNTDGWPTANPKQPKLVTIVLEIRWTSDKMWRASVWYYPANAACRWCHLPAVFALRVQCKHSSCSVAFLRTLDRNVTAVFSWLPQKQETYLLLTGRAEHYITALPIEYDSRNNRSHMTSDWCNRVHTLYRLCCILRYRQQNHL